MSKVSGFIREILAEHQTPAPDRARFVADTAAYLFRDPVSGSPERRVQKGMASARACCCELRDQIRAALDRPAPSGDAGR